LKQLKKPWIISNLSVHLCHELAAGNGGRIDEVITNVASYIKSVSISGATESEQIDTALPLWYWAIKPLNMGTYDYTKYYKALYENDYEGPIAIHTWGIFKNFGLAPKDHLPDSRNILLELAIDVCK
jgi:sugar phosphate isomerase/epimerase